MIGIDNAIKGAVMASMVADFWLQMTPEATQQESYE